MGRRVRFVEPTTVIYVDAFTIYCPVCKRVDMTHEHEGQPPVIGTPVILPTPAEHNWLCLRFPDGENVWHGASEYRPIKLGLLHDDVKLGFPKAASDG